MEFDLKLPITGWNVESVMIIGSLLIIIKDFMLKLGGNRLSALSNFTSSATSTQPIIVQFLNSVITEFLFILLWVLAPYAGS
jgi:hypothetical protein